MAIQLRSKRVKPVQAAVVSQALLPGLDIHKTYMTVPELSEKVGAAESEILNAIRFGVLEAVKFPVRGARLFRVAEGDAQMFARKFYAKLI